MELENWLYYTWVLVHQMRNGNRGGFFLSHLTVPLYPSISRDEASSLLTHHLSLVSLSCIGNKLEG